MNPKNNELNPKVQLDNDLFTDDLTRKNYLAQTYNALARLASESTINLDRNPLDTSIGNAEIGQCKTYLKINTVPVDGTAEVDLIPNSMAAFSTLFGYAANLRGTETDFVTALKFYYGMNTALDKIVIIYQPLLLYRDQEIDAQNKIYSYLEKSGSYYRWNGVDSFVTVADPKPFFDRYTANIKIQHFVETGTPFTDYIKDVDTTAAVFSFQEILSEIVDNLSDKIWVSNAVLISNDDPVVQNRHTILLSSTDVTLEKTFTGLFANLAHLCPPHCKYYYRLH